MSERSSLPPAARKRLDDEAKRRVDDLCEDLRDENPEAVRFDGLDYAVIGIARQHAGMAPVLCYSEGRIIELLCERFSADNDPTDAMTPEEHAWDWYGFNIECLAVGAGTPVILHSEIDE